LLERELSIFLPPSSLPRTRGRVVWLRAIFSYIFCI